VSTELRTAEVNQHVSHVARIPAVRAWLDRVAVQPLHVPIDQTF